MFETIEEAKARLAKISNLGAERLTLWTTGLMKAAGAPKRHFQKLTGRSNDMDLLDTLKDLQKKTASGFTHDIDNFQMAVMANAARLLERAVKADELEDLLSTITQRAGRQFAELHTDGKVAERDSYAAADCYDQIDKRLRAVFGENYQELIKNS